MRFKLSITAKLVKKPFFKESNLDDFEDLNQKKFQINKFS